MPSYTYGPMVAYSDTGTILRSGSGQVYAEGDTTFSTPLAVTDLAGVPLVTVAIDAQGVTQSFIADVPTVIWKSGDYVLPIFSPTGTLAAAQTAAFSAVEAAGSAEQARIAAEAAAALADLPTDASVASVLQDDTSAAYAAVVAIINLVGVGGGVTGLRMFPVRYSTTTSTWDFPTLEDALTGGMNEADQAVFTGNPTGEPAAWARDTDLWVQGG